MRNVFILCAMAALATLTACHSRPDGSVTVHDPWVRATVTGVMVSAGYARIENGTGDAVRLIGAETPVAGRVELHNVTMENDVMRMRPLADGLDIPAGQSVELRPGSYHMMLLELRRPLRSGERVPITLRFARGEPQRVEFTVRAATPAPHGAGHQ